MNHFKLTMPDLYDITCINPGSVLQWAEVMTSLLICAALQIETQVGNPNPSNKNPLLLARNMAAEEGRVCSEICHTPPLIPYKVQNLSKKLLLQG